MLKRITYQFNGQPRSRCFRVVDGELAPIECPPSPPVPAGLGDLVADGTRAVGIKPCGRCKRRQAWLNRWTPAWLAGLISRIRSR